MKSFIIASLFASAVFGAQAGVYNDSARVHSAKPQYENVNVPRNACSSQWIEERGGRGDYGHQSGQDRSCGDAIVSGLSGGVIGHQITGHRVAYEYRSQNYPTFMHPNLSNSLPVRVSVEPIIRSSPAHLPGYHSPSKAAM